MARPAGAGQLASVHARARPTRYVPYLPYALPALPALPAPPALPATTCPSRHRGAVAGRDASSFSISSITRFISFIARLSGSSVVMSTPASLRRSIGYFDPPADRKSRYFLSAALSPALTFSASAADAVNDVAYWKT